MLSLKNTEKVLRCIVDEEKVVEKIRVIMKEKGITQRRIAKDCRISENYVNQMLGIGKSKRRKISDEILNYFGFTKIEIYKQIEEEIENGRIDGTEIREVSAE